MAGRKKNGTAVEAKTIPLDPNQCSCGHPKADHMQTGGGKSVRHICFNFGCECHIEWKQEVVAHGSTS